MNDLAPIVHQARVFIEQSVPAGVLERTAALAILILLGGIRLSVFGAKMAKPALTGALALLGAAAGVAFTRLAGLGEMPGPIIGAIMGAAMFWTVAALTFRIWVGVVTAIVFSSIALGTFGYERIVPHVAEFDGMVISSAVAETDGLALPARERQQPFRGRPPRQWAAEFWAFATGKDATLQANSQLVGYGALAAGLFLGVVAVRWMLILSTSILGTALVASSVATLLGSWVPGAYQTILGHPGVVGMGMGAFLVTSLVLQTLLTRKAPAAAEQLNAKS